MNLGLIIWPGMFNLGMANHSGQAPWPMAEKIHTNTFNLFSRTEEKLHPRCCSRIRGRMKTEQFISQDVRTLRMQKQLSFYSWFRSQDLGRLVMHSVELVRHVHGGFVCLALPPPQPLASPGRRGRIPFVSFPVSRGWMSHSLLGLLPSKKGIR